MNERKMRVIESKLHRTPFQRACQAIHRCVLLSGGSVKRVHTEYVLYKDAVGVVHQYKNYTFRATLLGRSAEGCSPAGAAKALLASLGYDVEPMPR